MPMNENHCEKDQDCRDTSVMLCDSGLGECVCKNDTLVLSSSHRCLPGRELSQECQDSKQCEIAVANSICSDGKCNCADGYFLFIRVNSSICESKDKMMTDGDFEATPQAPNTPRHNVDPNMIIIMVVLAVMFIGICVALHLFSKARFRNHRTIFNSPHPRLMHIKLGKKKGRRRASHTSLEAPGSRQLSICSQLSPVQSRRGSRATSPDFSRRSQKSYAEKKENSRTSKPQKDSPSISSADNLLNKGAVAKHAMSTDSPVSSSAAPNGPGSPTVIVSNRSAAQPPGSSSVKA